MKNPKLSIILPTYNAEADLKRFFKSFSKQRFPASSVELIIMDGGSKDNTVGIARRHRARVIHNPYKLTEPGVALGFKYAKAPLVMILAADNIFPHPDAIRTMVGVFENKHIVAAFPKHDTEPGDNLYSRYINTFTDPFTHFVYGDGANSRTFHRIYKTLLHTVVYDIYDYRSHPVRPIIALAQGFTVRKSSIPARKEISDDILTVYNLIDKGNLIAYVHSVTLWHYTIRDTRQFIAKQRRALENALLRQDSGIMKRQATMTGAQRIRMYLFIPYALTIVLPLLQSIINAIRYREHAWLLHWYVSFFSAVVLLINACLLSIGKLFQRI